MRTDADDELLHAIADEVDTRLRDVSDGTRQPGPDELLFAVIGLANDLVVARRELTRVKAEVRAIAEVGLAELDSDDRGA
jgi:hypothetical protein